MLLHIPQVLLSSRERRLPQLLQQRLGLVKRGHLDIVQPHSARLYEWTV